ncbi:MAG: acetyl-CoA carboxylase biotin carboxyl carrier protein [Defluviicoccus sp.]|nr:acetyl-CoA carboxylase biotin carboxyl carrier protein [Defluviicoccus sp.]
MELTDEDVREILDLIDRSAFDYFEIEYRGLRLTVSKTPIAAAPARPRPLEPDPEPAPSRTRDIPDGLAAIPAPMVGTFYPAPQPGAPPFVSAGDRVEPDTTVGLIEVMKVFTAVTAGIAGTIEQALAGDAQGVEYGEPLFLVRPDGG